MYMCVLCSVCCMYAVCSVSVVCVVFSICICIYGRFIACFVCTWYLCCLYAFVVSVTFQSLPFYFSAQVKNINIFAFSYFFDRATELGLIGNALKFMPLSSSGIFGVQLWLLLSPLHQIKQITYYTAL